MFKSIIKWLRTKEYTLSEDQWIEAFKIIEIDIRKEIDKEYINQIEELQKIVQEKNNYITTIEKEYSSLIIEADILQAKLKKNEPKLLNPLVGTASSSLANEIFKE